MKELELLKRKDKCLIATGDLFSVLKGKDESSDNYRDAHLTWLADRITSLDLEEGTDYFICVNSNVAIEMLKFESVSKDVKRGLEVLLCKYTEPQNTAAV